MQFTAMDINKGELKMRVWIGFILLFVCNVSHADLAGVFKKLEQVIGEGTQQESTEIDQSSFSMNEIEIGPDGIEATCNSMYNNASNDQFNIKSSGWTQEIVDFLKKKAETCVNQKTAAINPDKYPGYIESEKKKLEWTNLFIDRKYEHALSQREAQRKSDEDYKKMQETGKCQQSDTYELYKNQNAVVDYQQVVNDYKALQKKEQAIAKESGVRNLAIERNIVIKMVTFRDLRDAHFKLYRKYGGTVSTAEKVTREVKDPCL